MQKVHRPRRHVCECSSHWTMVIVSRIRVDRLGSLERSNLDADESRFSANRATVRLLSPHCSPGFPTSARWVRLRNLSCVKWAHSRTSFPCAVRRATGSDCCGDGSKLCRNWIGSEAGAGAVARGWQWIQGRRCHAVGETCAGTTARGSQHFRVTGNMA